MGDLSAALALKFAVGIVCVQYYDTRGPRHAGERRYSYLRNVQAERTQAYLLIFSYTFPPTHSPNLSHPNQDASAPF